MKICENGVIREMTAAEIAEFEEAIAEIPELEPTPEERIAALEAENVKLKEKNNMLEECIVELAEIIYQ